MTTDVDPSRMWLRFSRSLHRLTLAVFLVAGAFLASILLVSLYASLADRSVATVSVWTQLLAFSLGKLCAVGAVIYHTPFDRGRIGTSHPSWLDPVIVLFGTAVLVGIQGVAMFLANAMEISFPEHQLVVLFTYADFSSIFLMVILSIVVIGPVEELLYRGVIQSHLAAGFGSNVGIVATSALFALEHLLVVAEWTMAGIGAGMLVVFLQSIVLGYLYHRRKTIVVPGLVHGLFNAYVFASLL